MELAHHGLVLLQQLNSQREFGFLCDCTVAIGDVYFKAHKAVLAAFSNYFRMLFIHQDSECVRLKPSDIQPEIFSYLLNLMYTGKLTTQLIDPLCLEQGVQFLHAYPLLQEASLLINPEAHCVPLTNSLYGIQISDQSCGMPSTNTVCKYRTWSESRSETLANDISEVPETKVNNADVCSLELTSKNTATSQHITTGIVRRNASFRKHYICRHCNSRFNQKYLLKEHLLLHAAKDFEHRMSSGVDGCTMELEGQEGEYESLRVDSDDISDTEHQMKREKTPPPSDIADIDNLEALEREVKRRKFECPTCGRKFIQKSHWREHMYIHTGKPYRCSACGKSFCRPSQAARHVCLNQGMESYTMVNKESMVLCGSEETNQAETFFLSSSQHYKCSACALPFGSPSEVLTHQCPTVGTEIVMQVNPSDDHRKGNSVTEELVTDQ
ncbi:zinc finger and BTB domain-containing protein 2-like [Brachyhypopomus gauderio]|uniref:zinc finger and BTB domain-containing protein 2-like n=1 Tax=Brachyhypopomus gauderio TaxID=698409 RepID=UPI0040415034